MIKDKIIRLKTVTIYELKILLLSGFLPGSSVLSLYAILIILIAQKNSMNKRIDNNIEVP